MHPFQKGSDVKTACALFSFAQPKRKRKDKRQRYESDVNIIAAVIKLPVLFFAFWPFQRDDLHKLVRIV